MDPTLLRLPDVALPLLDRNRALVETIMAQTIATLEARIPPLTREEIEKMDLPQIVGTDPPPHPITSGGSEALRQALLTHTRQMGIREVCFLSIKQLTDPNGEYACSESVHQLTMGLNAHERTTLADLAEKRFWVERSFRFASEEMGRPLEVPLTYWCDRFVNRITQPLRWRLTSISTGDVEYCIKQGFRTAFAYPIALALLGRAQDAEWLAGLSIVIPDCLPLYVDRTGRKLTVLVRD